MKLTSQCQEQVISCELLVKVTLEPFKSVHAVAILLSCLPQLDRKTILLETSHTSAVEQRNQQHGPGNSRCWLDFIVLEGATQTAGRKYKNGLTQC